MAGISDDLIRVAIDAVWETIEMVPIGTVRRFTQEDGGQPGWGMAWAHSTASSSLRSGLLPATIFRGAKMPDTPRRRFTMDGVDYDEPEPNWGVEERFIEAAVRALDPRGSR